MGWLEYLILAVVAVWLIATVIWTHKRRGKGACSGCCADCTKCCHK